MHIIFDADGYYGRPSRRHSAMIVLGCLAVAVVLIVGAGLCRLIAG